MKINRSDKAIKCLTQAKKKTGKPNAFFAQDLPVSVDLILSARCEAEYG